MINIDPIKKYLYLNKTFLNLFIFVKLIDNLLEIEIPSVKPLSLPIFINFSFL